MNVNFPGCSSGSKTVYPRKSYNQENLINLHFGGPFLFSRGVFPSSQFSPGRSGEARCYASRGGKDHDHDRLNCHVMGGGQRFFFV